MYILVILCFLIFRLCYGDLFTANVHLEKLVETQTELTELLQITVREIEKYRNHLDNTLLNFKLHDDVDKKNPEKYVEDPIHVFTLVKRLLVDYEETVGETLLLREKLTSIFTKRRCQVFPDQEDFVGSVAGIVRIIDTYKLDHKELSYGKIFDVQGIPMSSDDCYEFAQKLFEAHDFEYAVIWLEEAKRKFGPSSKFTLFSVYFNMAECYTFSGELAIALEWYDYILSLLPNNQIAKAKKAEILKTVAAHNGTWRFEFPEHNKVHHDELMVFYKPGYSYEALCRDEMEPDVETTKRLKCFNKYGESPFLRIAPLKIEELHPKASMYLFHDVISKYEIEWSKHMSKERMARALVINHEARTYEIANYRISKAHWIFPSDHKETLNIYYRVEDMTDLNAETAAPYQVVNYGVGGYYGLHYDFSKNQNRESTKFPVRIATVLFYISDVEKGGATVFPDLGVTVMPKKGSALVWTNLHSSGEGNLLTKHAACPVLLGSKWVSTVWLHYGGQEFKQPCELVYRSENDDIMNTVPLPRQKQLKDSDKSDD